MEQKVKFTSTTKFAITEEEFKHFYTVMALIHYPYECDPEYKDSRIIRRLHNDLHRFNQEIIKIHENDPNNLIVSQIRNFIHRHYGYIRKIDKEFGNSSEV